MKTQHLLIAIIITLIVALMPSVSLWAAQKKTSKKEPARKERVFLDSHTIAGGYTYTGVRTQIASALSEAGYIIVHTPTDADWAVSVTGQTLDMQQTDFGSISYYAVKVEVTILIDRGNFRQRRYEGLLTEKGRHTIGFDEAATEAYNKMIPQLQETIIQHLTE